ncbi:hypothetical protein ACT29H_05680 [Thermophagus sp. OGC60D27]|uniref:hypothetical protein n=1 Tax=Thermophagus sp. OGC60D27 TaxID=3458415 RepID=UPI0040381941
MEKINYLFISVLIINFVLAIVFNAPKASILAEVLDIGTQAKSLFKLLALKEKIFLLGYNNPPIERLKVLTYNWRNAPLHGLARAGESTISLQAITLTTTSGTTFVYKNANAISSEARSQYNPYKTKGFHSQRLHISFWTLNIKIFRNLSWKQGLKTFGIDTFQTANKRKTFVKRLQGNQPVNTSTQVPVNELNNWYTVNNR